MREKYSSHQLKTVTSCQSVPHSHYSRDNLERKIIDPKNDLLLTSLRIKHRFYDFISVYHKKISQNFSLEIFFRTTLFCKIVGAWFEYLFLKRGNASRPGPPLQPNNTAVDEWNRSLIQFRIKPSWSWVIDMTSCQAKLINDERKNYFI